jgi:hypothetical protein
MKLRGMDRIPSDPAEGAHPDGPSPGSEVLLIEGGELDDVYEALVALGVEPMRSRAVDAKGFSSWEKPPRLVVVSARAATRLNVDATKAPGVIRIAVADGDSHTLDAILRRQGFDYVVRRPVHPDALRLLLMRVLYCGTERRSEPRVPVGCAVTTRWKVRWRPATLLEISIGGCRFLGQKRLEKGTMVWIRIPGSVAGGRTLKLRGSVQRSETAPGEASKGAAIVALSFGRFGQVTRRRLEALIAASATGPPALPQAVGRTSQPAPEPTSAANVDDAKRGTQRPPRLQPRASYEHEVVVLDGDAEQVRQVLFARDLSVGGVRVDPHPDLQLGDRFRLALYDASFSESVVVDAEVLRDDGERGIALRFVKTSAETVGKIGRILEQGGAIEECDVPGEARQVTIAEVVQHDRA